MFTDLVLGGSSNPGRRPHHTVALVVASWVGFGVGVLIDWRLGVLLILTGWLLAAARARGLVLRTARPELQPRFAERGVAALEFGMVLPLITVVVFGIVEFGAAWSQHTDVRHGARETARLAAVNYNPLDRDDGAVQVTDIITEACSRMGNGDGATIDLTLSGTSLGDVVEVTVTQSFDSLTGFVPVSSELTSTVEFRLERPATWTEPPGPVACAPLLP